MATKLQFVLRWAVTVMLALLWHVTAVTAQAIVYPDFSDVSNLTLNGDAAQTGNVVRLTPALADQAGSAFETVGLMLNPTASFNTQFAFQISSPGGASDPDGPGADGITFVIQEAGPTALGALGGWIGYNGIPGNSIAVEFDSWDNGPALNDPNGNHIGIDLDGNIASAVTAIVGPPRLNDGDVFHAWIDYNGDTDFLEVRLSSSPVRPALPTLTYSIDLAPKFGGKIVYVGFTSGTGAANGNHDILSWYFDYPQLSKHITSGPDLDGNGEIDLAVEVGKYASTVYDFTVFYNAPGGPPVLIEDTVPAEWDVEIFPSNQLLNGDFETGDFTGWSQFNSGYGGIVIDDGTFVPDGPGEAVAPYEGSYAAVTFQSGYGVHTLYRDVSIPTTGGLLVWADHIQNWYGEFVDPSQEWRVEVRNPADNSVLAELFSTNPGDLPLQDWTERQADLTPWAGQTIRIAFTEQDSSYFFNARLDDVQVLADNLNCNIASANKKDNGKSATKIDCYPDGDSGRATFWTTTRGHKNGKYRPTSCGALYLNDGAVAYEVDAFGEPLVDPDTGERLPPILESDSLCLAAVEDVYGDGIDYTGAGDEDADGLKDWDEACVFGTDPCVADAALIEQLETDARAWFGLRGDSVRVGQGQSFNLPSAGTLTLVQFMLENSGLTLQGVPPSSEVDSIECALRDLALNVIATAAANSIPQGTEDDPVQDWITLSYNTYLPAGDYVVTCELLADTWVSWLGNTDENSYPGGTRYSSLDGTIFPFSWDSVFRVFADLE